MAKVKFTESKTTKKINETNNDTKLLVAINSLNNTLDKNFKTLSNTLKDSSKSKGSNKNNEIDKIKLEREKSLTAHQLKIQALQEKILKQRMQQANENHERYVNKHYGENIASVPSKVYNNIKGQGSNAGSALALSLMTGGIINPVIAKEFGLDKIVTASTKFAGRTISKATSTAWNMTGGLAWNNLKQPFVDPNSRLRQGMSRGANKVSKAFSNPFSLFSNNESDGKQAGAVAKDKDKLSKIEKNTQDMVKLLSKPKDEAQSQEKEKKKSLLDKIFEAIGGMGLILKGAAVAAIPYVVKTFLPKATEWLDEKFKGFLNGTLGLSESSTEGVSQLVKDALPGALFGLTVGGFKGALIGGSLSIGANWIKRKWDEFQGKGDQEGKPPAKIGPIPASYVEAMIGGAALGSLFGFKGIAIGALIGLAGQGLWDLGKKFGEWTAGLANWLTKVGLNPVASITALVGISGKALKNIGKNLLEFGKSVANFVKHPIDSLKQMFDIGKNGEDVAKEIAKDAKKGKIKTGKIVKNTSKGSKALKAAKGIGKVAGKAVGLYAAADAAIEGVDVAKDLYNKGLEKTSEDYQREAEAASALDNFIGLFGPKFGWNMEALMGKGLRAWDPLNKYGDTKKADPNAGGYGTLGPISNNGILHGVKATSLKQMGLKGSIVSSNSIPYIASQNEQALKSLDEILNGWGYEVIYTSAMGGHKPGTGHWKGNKVDLQLKKNGRPTHLSGKQLSILSQAGYWGRGTGALGWEPVSGQVGGGHYDLYIGGSNSGTALASAANMKLETNDMPTSQESQVFAMNEMNETAQASAENTANSNDSILGMLDNMNTNIANNSYGGLSGLGQSIDISMPSIPSISASSSGTQGGAGSQTGNVYAFGDVAKTPILYTL